MVLEKQDMLYEMKWFKLAHPGSIMSPEGLGGERNWGDCTFFQKNPNVLKKIEKFRIFPIFDNFLIFLNLFEKISQIFSNGAEQFA
jgi:hypothetical protein